LADDDVKVLDKVKLEMESRPVKWAVDPKESSFWSIFTEEEQNRMAKENIAMHAHDYAISLKTFNKYPKLVDFMKITQTDTANGKPFVNALEAKNYPIYGTMYHPEYNLFPG